MKTDARLPYTEIDDGFLPPRDPVLGLIKIGGREAKIRYARGTGRPWVAPTRFLDPARFEIVTREKRTQTVKGAKGSSVAGKDFTVDLGYVRDDDFHALEGVGEQPSALKIRLLYPAWNQNLIAFLGAYGGREWVCRGNGVKATDIKRGECKCPCPRLVQFSGKYEGAKPTDQLICKPHAQLNVILEDAGVFGGFWAFKTTSYETISNLGKSLRMFEEMFGRIDGLPLELRVMAATKQIPGGGTTVQPIVTLVLPASMDTARQLAAKAADESRKYLPAGGELDETKYLAAVVSEMEQEAEAYAGEFLALPAGEVLEGEEVEAEGVVAGELRKQEEIQAMQRAAEATVAAAEAEMAKAGDQLAAELERRSAENAEDEERGDGPEGSGGSRPSPPDDHPNQEDGDAGDDGDESDEHNGAGEHPSEGGRGGRRVREPRDLPTVRSNDSRDGEERDIEDGGRDRGDDPEAVDDSDRNDSEQLARDVLKATGTWDTDAIDGRLAYHIKTNTLDTLLERLERNHPEAWAKVAQPDEPTDGLPF